MTARTIVYLASRDLMPFYAVYVVLFESEGMSAGAIASLLVAWSLTEFLLSKGERRALIDCIEQSQQDGWNAALGKCYSIASIAELQRQWQEWAAR